MFGKVKKILGIEGVKLELNVENTFAKNDERISGNIKLTTKTSATITSISVRLIEKYSRGRKNTQLIDEYVLGELELKDNFAITSDEIIEVPFELEFVNLQSEVDKMAEGNILLRGPIIFAKMLKKVTSTFRLEAHAHVEGTKLQPFAEAILKPE
jgi:sporulation-control protein spo0M